MTTDSPLTNQEWNAWEKLAFRFFFLFFMLHTEPWCWPAFLPYIGEYLSIVTNPYYDFFGWLTSLIKEHILNTTIEITPNGSGDTIDSWVIYTLVPIIALAGTITWSLLDRRRPNYDLLSAWLHVVVRYYLAMNMLIYGLIKLFPLQMPAPSISQLLTPLGDFSRMRLAWVFIGSSSSYEIFAGACELAGGLLLLSRRTTSLGALILVTVLTHVVVLNYSFDIPVKLFSSLLLLMSIYLLVPNIRQLWRFFILHEPVRLSFPNIYLNKKWMRFTRIALKTLFIAAFLISPVYENMKEYSKAINPWGSKKGVITGIFDVEKFRLGNQEITPQLADTTRWENLVMEEWNGGSIKSGVSKSSSLRYGRDYFEYEADTVKKILNIKFRKDTIRNFQVRYGTPDPAHLELTSLTKNDSLYILLKQRKHSQFLLTKPAKWVQNTVP